MRRILLDECVDERLCDRFLPHEAESARYAGLGGRKDGDLLLAAELSGFDVIVTVDGNIPIRQNSTGRRIAVLVLCCGSSRLRDLEKLIPDAQAALERIAPGE